MTSYRQEVLFRKVRCLFDRCTVGIPTASKKKYRLSTDELSQVRNLSVLFAQIWPFLSLDRLLYVIFFGNSVIGIMGGVPSICINLHPPYVV